MAGKKGRSGRKPVNVDTKEIQKTMTQAGRLGAQLVRDYIRGKDAKGNKVSITAVKLTAALQSIAHAIGTPTIKQYIMRSGDDLTLRDLAELAELFDKKAVQSLKEAVQGISEGDTSEPQPTVEYIPERVKMSGN